MAPGALLIESPIEYAGFVDPLDHHRRCQVITTPRVPKEVKDWRAGLKANGYAVVKNAIPHDRAVAYQKKAFDWISSFDRGLDIADPSTWTEEHLPIGSKNNLFRLYCVSHEKFVWDARMEPGVLDAFAKLWGTEELLVSFDAINITFPNRADKERLGGWEHVDQSPMRKGLHCVQGIINLSHAGPNDGGLVVYPGSHALVEEFFATQTDKSTWKPRDFYMFDEEQLKFFTSRGLKPHKICAEPGDLILWDSRTIHYGSEPEPSSNTIRMVIYAAYTPAKLAKPDALKVKADIFNIWGCTTHWPHDNIVLKDQKTILGEGVVDPLSRDEPREKPEVTDQLLKLAGVIPY